MTTATEPVPTAPETTTPDAAAPETQNPPAPVAKEFNPEALPSEIKSYVQKQKEAAAAEASKKYADYDRRVAEAREWESVRNDPRFQKFAESLRTPEPPKKFEISDDQFAAALSDKGQFAALVQEAAKALIEQSGIGKDLESVKQHNDFQEKVGELQQTVTKYPDFKDLDKRGLIEPLIRKYPGLTFEDAYKIAKHETINEEADRRARGIVDGKKKAVIEKPAASAAQKGPRMNAKNREEAMNLVAEAIRAGRPVPEFDEIGDS